MYAAREADEEASTPETKWYEPSYDDVGPYMRIVFRQRRDPNLRPAARYDLYSSPHDIDREGQVLET